jgi:hypothetical protein
MGDQLIATDCLLLGVGESTCRFRDAPFVVRTFNLSKERQ